VLAVYGGDLDFQVGLTLEKIWGQQWTVPTAAKLPSIFLFLAKLFFS